MKPQPQFLSYIETVLESIATVCTFISGLSLIVIVLTFSWLVFGRYILNDTPTWVEQLSLLLMTLITFLSSAVGVKDNTHLCVDVLPSILPDLIRRKIHCLVYAALAVFGMLMALQAFALTTFSWGNIIPLLDISEGLKTVPMTLSGILIALFSLGKILETLVLPISSPKQDQLPQTHTYPTTKTSSLNNGGTSEWD